MKSTVGSLVTTGGDICGFTLDPSRSVCDSVRPRSYMLQPCSVMTQRTIFFPSATPRIFPQLFPPLTLPSVCERPKSELAVFYKALFYFCRLFCVFHPAGAFFSFALLMEAASWNYRKLPLSNDLLVKPTITALSRPSEHS